MTLKIDANSKSLISPVDLDMYTVMGLVQMLVPDLDGAHALVLQEALVQLANAAEAEGVNATLASIEEHKVNYSALPMPVDPEVADAVEAALVAQRDKMIKHLNRRSFGQAANDLKRSFG